MMRPSWPSRAAGSARSSRLWRNRAGAAHGLGRRAADRPCAGQGGQHHHPERQGQGPGRHPEDHLGKAEVLAVQAGHPAGGPGAEGDAQRPAGQHDGAGQQGIVAGQLPVAIAECLEHGQLLALGLDDAPHHHVEQEGRDREEDGRQHAGHQALLGQLLLEEAMGLLVVAGLGAGAAVAGQGQVQGVDHVFLAGPGLEGQGQAVEGPLHVVGIGQGALVHPHHGIAAVVRHQVGGRGLVEVFRAQGNAGKPKSRLAAIDDCLEGIARRQVVCLGEGVADHHLVVATGRRQGAGEELQAVQGRLAAVGNRHQQAADGVGEAGHGQAHRGPDPGLDLVDPRDLLQPWHQPRGGALDVGEDLGEVVTGVEAVPGSRQRLQGGDGEDQRHHAAGDHHGDGQGLALEAPEVSMELTVQGQHGITSAATRAGGGGRWCGSRPPGHRAGGSPGRPSRRSPHCG